MNGLYNDGYFMPNSTSLTTKHKSLRYLIRELRNNPNYRHLAPVDSTRLEVALSIPVAIARWIEVFRPSLKDKARLHIAIVGAEEGPDKVDDGRWYQLVPFLLGKGDMEISVTLVGPKVMSSTRGGIPALHKVSCFTAFPAGNGARALHQWRPAKIAKQTAGEFIGAADSGDDVVDLFFLSHPGFEKHHEWLNDAELGALLRTGAPVAVASYDTLEYEQDRWLLDTFGFADTGKVDINPFSVPDDDALLTTANAHTLWEVNAEHIPGAGFKPTKERQTLMNYYGKWGAVLFEMGALKLSEERDPIVINDATYWRLLPGFFSDSETGEVFELEVRGRDVYGDTTGFNAHEALGRSMPANPEFQFEQQLWMAEAAIKLGEFLHAKECATL